MASSGDSQHSRETQISLSLEETSDSQDETERSQDFIIDSEDFTEFQIPFSRAVTLDDPYEARSYNQIHVHRSDPLGSG